MSENLAELSLWLDDFDDIYSDFDSRHFLKRRISDDFLHELQLSLKYRDTPINNLVLLIPKQKRNSEIEKDTITSLHNYFSHQFYLNENRYRKVFWKSMIMLFSGIIIMSVNFIFNFKYQQNIALSLLRVLFEPAGWFLMWAGLDALYYDLHTLKKEKAKFNSLAQMKIHFQSSD